MAFVIVKLAGACNLNCSYCYVYNGADQRHLLRPRIMDRDVAKLTVDRVFAYTMRSGERNVVLSFHGGEPLLVGKEYFHWLLEYIRQQRPEGVSLKLSVQTNGVLLDREWLDLFAACQVGVGVSLDGPAAIHDRYRVDHAGNGSYRKVRRAIALLREDGRIGWGVLSVINPEHNGIEIYRHFREIGVSSMDFLMQDFTHDTKPEIPAGATPYADYLIPIFDEWYSEGNPAIRIRTFEAVMSLLLGGTSPVDAIGGGTIDEMVVEADGSLEPLDVLRACGDGFTFLGLNVLTDELDDLRATPIFQTCLKAGREHAETCLQCPVFHVCGGGYLPHRYSRALGFANPSVHCADLEKLILHIAGRMAPDIPALSR